MRSLQTEIDNYKKSITKEQERNEELTMMVNKVEADINHVKKQIEVSAAKREELKVEYMTYTRTLQETEQALAKASTVSKSPHTDILLPNIIINYVTRKYVVIHC